MFHILLFYVHRPLSLFLSLSHHFIKGNTTHVNVYKRKTLTVCILSCLWSFFQTALWRRPDLCTALWSKGTPAWSETESITSKHTGTDARGKICLPCSDVTVSANDMQIHVCHSSHRQCCSGKELVDWLMKQNECLQSRSQAVGMWQVLVDEGILVHGKDYYEFFLESIFVWISITLTFGQHPKIKDMSCFGWVLLYSGIFLIYSDDLKSLRVRLSFFPEVLK